MGVGDSIQVATDIGVRKELVWDILVSCNWESFTDSILYAHFDGEMVEGAKGQYRFKEKHGTYRTSTCEITTYEAGERFSLSDSNSCVVRLERKFWIDDNPDDPTHTIFTHFISVQGVGACLIPIDSILDGAVQFNADFKEHAEMQM